MLRAKPASCFICLNSLDTIGGFSFLWVTFGLQKFAFFLLHFLLHLTAQKKVGGDEMNDEKMTK